MEKNETTALWIVETGDYQDAQDAMQDWWLYMVNDEIIDALVA